MARVVALIPDLLFGSRVQAALTGAGHDVELVSDPARVAECLPAGAVGVDVADGDAPESADGAEGTDMDGAEQTHMVNAAAVLVVDLTDADFDGAGLMEVLADQGLLGRGRTRTLGFYAHVDVSVRERAERAGFDLVVPRSRMAREGAELVRRLAG